MNINYIVLLHKGPKQAKRLINKLTNANTSFYIHVDRKVDIVPFKKAFDNLRNVVFLGDKLRCDGVWGGFGLVQAALNGLKQILLDKKDGYCVLLSGQDYPLRSSREIEKFFEERSGKEFITCFSMVPGRVWWPEPDGLPRLNRYNFRKSRDRYDFVLFPSFLQKEFYKRLYIEELAKLLIRGHFLFALRLFKKRKFPEYAVPYGGNQWWALTVSTVKNMFSFLNQHPDFLLYFRDSLIPDEIFFQSVIKNIVEESLIENDLTYANWERKGVTLPVTFTIEDIEELKMHAREKLYARKFDVEIDNKILDALDSLINQPSEVNKHIN